MTDIIAQLTHSFHQLFHGQPLIVRSPGRINIIGEHTDYNEGFVLPASIDMSAYIAISLRNDKEIRLKAINLNECFSVSTEGLKPIQHVSWPNYIIGPAAQFAKKGIGLPGFNAVLISEVPIGAGLSSSAAVECATVFALNELLGTKLSRLEMVRMAQQAEHEFAGVMCGIMDQFASMMGKKDHLIKLDCRSLDFEYVPFPLNDVKIVLMNTNVKHALASSEYNLRKQECETAVRWVRQHIPEVNSLRDVTEKMLDQYVFPRSRTIGKRALYVVEEIQRLLSACEDMKHANVEKLGEKMFLTHEELRRSYEVSCKQLDWLVERVTDDSRVIGARMMGGGFGGCTINLVKTDDIEPFVDEIRREYEKQMKLPLTHYVVSIGSGTEIINQRL